MLLFLLSKKFKFDLNQELSIPPVARSFIAGVCAPLLCLRDVMSRELASDVVGQDFGRLHRRISQLVDREVAEDRRAGHRKHLLQVCTVEVRKHLLPSTYSEYLKSELVWISDTFFFLKSKLKKNLNGT